MLPNTTSPQNLPRTWAGDIYPPTDHLRVALGTLGTTGATEAITICPFAGRLTAVFFASKDGLVSTNANHLDFSLVNKGQAGVGTTQMLGAGNLATTRFVSLSDLATTGASATVTSATAQFVAADVGSSLVIASGTNFIPGTYVITAFTSSSVVVLDRVCSTGNGASGVFTITNVDLTVGYKRMAVPLSVVTGALTVLAGDVLSVLATSTGTLPNTLTLSVIRLVFQRS